MTMISKTEIIESQDILVTDKHAKIRGLKINDKLLIVPAYFPKIERANVLNKILLSNELDKQISGIVIEIQDFMGITNSITSTKIQTTLDSNKSSYGKYKDKIIIIDTMPDAMYFKSEERENYKKIPGIHETIKALLDHTTTSQYDTKWRAIYNAKKGPMVQSWVLKHLSKCEADVIMPIVPFIHSPDLAMLNIAKFMNLDLQRIMSLSTVKYNVDSSYYFAMNYTVFSNKLFKDELIKAIESLSVFQEKMFKSETPFHRSTIVFIKIHHMDSKNTTCRENIRDFFEQLSALRDMYGLSFVFLDTADLLGQLSISCGADIFSDRTSCRVGMKSTSGSGFGPGKIFLAGDEFECAIPLDAYKKKFEKRGNKVLCAHPYCQKYLKDDISTDNNTNYNKESRRIHNLLSKVDHIDEVKKHIIGHDVKAIVWKIGNSSDSSLNYINPYYKSKPIDEILSL